MSITGGPGRGPVTDVGSTHVDGTNPAGDSEGANEASAGACMCVRVCVCVQVCVCVRRCRSGNRGVLNFNSLSLFFFPPPHPLGERGWREGQGQEQEGEEEEKRGIVTCNKSSS